MVVALWEDERLRAGVGNHGKAIIAELKSGLGMLDSVVWQSTADLPDSDAISASRKRPGMMYVRERNAPSI